MASISDIYSGDFVVAAQLPAGRRLSAVIVEAGAEAVGQGDNARLRVVLTLQSSDGRPWPKRAVCNKTNALVLAAAYGDDTTNWRGRPIEIWQEMTQFQGRLVPGIRLQPAAHPPGTGPAAATATGLPPLAQPRSTVVFDSGAPVYSNTPAGAASPSPSGLKEALNDEIPF